MHGDRREEEEESYGMGGIIVTSNLSHKVLNFDIALKMQHTLHFSDIHQQLVCPQHFQRRCGFRFDLVVVVTLGEPCWQAEPRESWQPPSRLGGG